MEKVTHKRTHSLEEFKNPTASSAPRDKELQKGQNIRQNSASEGPCCKKVLAARVAEKFEQFQFEILRSFIHSLTPSFENVLRMQRWSHLVTEGGQGKGSAKAVITCWAFKAQKCKQSEGRVVFKLA